VAKQKNWQAYNRLLSQDFIWIDDSGVLLGRELFLKYIADLDLIDYTMGSVKVTTLNNNTAMLTYKVILRRSRLFGQVPGRNKLKAGSRLLVSPFPEIKFILSRCGVCEACGQPTTCGQGGGNAWRFPRLVHRGPRLRGQAGIGAADCPQIHSTTSPWRQAASAGAAVNWPRYASSGVRQPSA